MVDYINCFLKHSLPPHQDGQIEERKKDNTKCYENMEKMVKLQPSHTANEYIKWCGHSGNSLTVPENVKHIVI